MAKTVLRREQSCACSCIRGAVHDMVGGAQCDGDIVQTRMRAEKKRTCKQSTACMSFFLQVFSLKVEKFVLSLHHTERNTYTQQFNLT